MHKLENCKQKINRLSDFFATARMIGMNSKMLEHLLVAGEFKYCPYCGTELSQFDKPIVNKK